MPSVKDIQYSTPSQPRQLRIDTVARCDATCLSCHRFLSKRDKGEMPIDLIDKLLSDVSRWRLDEIIPVNYGEFFLRDDWYYILTMISQKLPSTQIVIPTNGSHLDTDAVTKLCHIPTVRIINFSVNAYFDETYENFTGLKAENITRIRKAIAQLKILRSDILCRVSMVFDPLYQTDLEKDLFINYWGGCAEPWILPAASAGRVGKKPIHPVKLPCRSIFSDIVVSYDGKISSCCFDSNFSLDLGFYDGDLLANWHGKELTQLRKLHNEGQREEIELCAKCSFA